MGYLIENLVFPGNVRGERYIYEPCLSVLNELTSCEQTKSMILRKQLFQMEIPNAKSRVFIPFKLQSTINRVHISMAGNWCPIGIRRAEKMGALYYWGS
jgi:hypothetical protein